MEHFDNITTAIADTAIDHNLVTMVRFSFGFSGSQFNKVFTSRGLVSCQARAESDAG